MSQEDLKKRSGSVRIKSRLVSFLYDLIRDHLTPGVVEELMGESTDVEVEYTNGYLAQYAIDVAYRLNTPSSLGAVGKDILSNYFMAVRSGNLNPSEAAEKLHKAINDLQESADVAPLDDAPRGLYGVYCEPQGHSNTSSWTAFKPQSYDAAVKEADFMNRSNCHWHYYAKPVRDRS